MSSVRMCDKCGTVFSERAEDWTTFTGSTRRRNRDTGKVETVTDTLDQCPECSQITLGPAARPELTTRPDPLNPQQPTVSPHYEGQGET